MGMSLLTEGPRGGGFSEAAPLLVPPLPPSASTPTPPASRFPLNSLQTSRIFVCAGGKVPLPVKLAPEPGPQAELREQRNAEGQGGGHAGSKLEGKAFAFLPHPPWGPATSAPPSQTHGDDGEGAAAGACPPGGSFRGVPSPSPTSVLPGVPLRRDSNHPLPTSSFLSGPSRGTVFTSLSPLKRTSVALSHGPPFPFVAP